MQGFRYIIPLVIAGSIALPSAHATFPGKNGRIAFVQVGEIFTMNSDGSEVRQLTHLGPDNLASWPSWSADGKQIVFNEFPPPNGVAELWLMNADGSGQHKLLSETKYGENRPSFSPDGSKVVFGRCKLDLGEGDSCGIFTIRTDRHEIRAIVPIRLGDTDRSPVYSPDGKTIAFIISPDEQAGFNGVTYLVDSDGSNRRRITPSGPCLIRPDWSPDNLKITLFAHFCNPQNEDIAVMNADGTNIQYLTHNGHDFYNGPHDRNPAWSPQGDYIVFERDAADFSSSAIYLIRPDGGGLKAIAHFPASKNVRRPTRRGQLNKIEDGGAIPRWGVAAE